MTNVKTAVALTVLIIAGAFGVLLYSPIIRVSSGTGSTTGMTTTCTSTGWTSTTTSGSTTVRGNFAPSSSSPVKVESVSAVVTRGANGKETLYFEVLFENVGTGTIYVTSGCGGSMNSTITSGDGVVQTVTGGVRCLCAEFMAPVNPSQAHTDVDPGCWSGYIYVVRQPGSFSAAFSLYWSTSSTSGGSNHLTIAASFTVS